jgi:probable phosphoglycerate mutase
MMLSPETRFVGPRRVHVIRHGCTALNAESGETDRIRGWVDVPLAPQGIEDAGKLALSLAKSGITLIYSSPLSRAFDTARPIAAATGAELVDEPGLKPWKMGIWNGMESNDVHAQMREYMVQRPNDKIPDGESFNTFKHRTLDAVARILEAKPGHSIAIVTHHRVERLLTAWDKAGQPLDRAIDMDEMLRHGEGTASAKIMTLDGGRMWGATSCDKEEKKDVDYGPAGQGPDRCGECSYFLKGFYPPLFTPLCRLVAGPIDAHAWCMRYLPARIEV